MSGPKISVYSLTGRAKAIVNGQMRCEQQSLACYAQILGITRSFQTFSELFYKIMRNIQILAKRTSEGLEQIEQLKSMEAEITAEAEAIQLEMSAHTPQISEKYTITEEAYAEKQAELKCLQALHKRAAQLKDKVDTAIAQDKKTSSRIQAGIFGIAEDDEPETGTSALNRIQNDNARSVQRIQESIVEDLSGIYSFDFENDESDTDFCDKKEASQKKLTDLLSDSSLPESIIGEIRRAISALSKIDSDAYLSTFDAVTVKAIVKKIDSFKHGVIEKQKEYRTLCERYEALCAMAGETAMSLPYSEISTERIIAETERLESLLIMQQEQAYISDCVDEVLTDMGYDLIGTREVQKKSGKHFRNELYTFDEGTAVNVTFSPDGQISMELGGLDHSDRVPTSDETEILTRNMENFCGAFAEFERRMLAKGVIVGSRIALSPPSAEYAAIINVDDYDVSEHAQFSVMSISEKRRKQAAKKSIRSQE